MELPDPYNEKTIVTEQDVPAAPPPTAEELEQLINQFAPLIHFHATEESALPVAAEWYLQKAWLVNAATKERVPAVTGGLNGFPKEGAHYFEPKENAVLFPNKAKPKAYVHATAGAAHTDLQYWFFFPRTGSVVSTLRWVVDNIKGFEGDVRLDPFGSYHGCWERITVRLSNSSRLAEQVFFPCSGNGVWLPANKVKWQNNQLLAYASCSDHSFHPAPTVSYGAKIKFDLVSSQLEVSMKYEALKGKEHSFTNACELISAPYLGDEQPEAPIWLNFEQHWGHPAPDYLSAAAVKRTLHAAFGRELDFLLSRDVLNELGSHLLAYAAERCRSGSLSPVARSCWNGETAG